MALSGSFQSSKDNSANINESKPRYPSYIYVTWEATQNIVNNTSTLSWKCYGGSDYNDTSAYVSSGPIVVKINDTTVLNITDRFRMRKDKLIGSGSLTLYHNADGSKSINTSITAAVYSYASNCSYSGTITLNTIPRSSSLSLSATSLYVGSTITANISSHSSSFTHNVEFYINNTYYQKYTEIKESKSFPIPMSWCGAMPSSTSCTAYCRITTYNNGVPIGDQVCKSFTITIPNDIVPVIGEINITNESILGKNVLVKDKNRVTFNVSNCSAGEGSSIKSYTFSVLCGSTVVATKTTTDTTVVFGPFSQIGTLKFKLTLTDNRGRSTSNSGSEPELTCYDYFNPYFSSFTTYRANSNGDADINGMYMKCGYVQKYASVNGTNSTTVTVHYNGKTSTDMLIYLGDNSTTYKVYLTITDTYGGSGASSTETIFGQSRILNITSDGTGVAIGKMSDKSNKHTNGLFECRWDAEFYGTASGPSGFSTSSDKRVKKNIQDIDIDVVDNLRPIQYELIKDDNNKIHYGFIAQDIEELWSNIGLNPNSFGILGQINKGESQEYVLTYTEFIPLLTKKCQCLQNEINTLKLEIENLKKGRD